MIRMARPENYVRDSADGKTYSDQLSGSWAKTRYSQDAAEPAFDHSHPDSGRF
jgi:hypothetical protein